jgi:2-keto-3-deoxygluconate permease
MRIKALIERFPAGLMVIPLLLGTLLNTIDQARLPGIQYILGEVLSAPPIGYTDVRKSGEPPVVQEIRVDRLTHLGGGTVQIDGKAVEAKQWLSVSSGTIATATGPRDLAEVRHSLAGEPVAVSVTDPKLPYYEMLRLGGFSEALFKNSALPLIALFLLIVGSQMNLRIGARALAKGATLTATKFMVGFAVGALIGGMDPTSGWLGLSSVAIIAAMTNENGGMFVALTRQFGSRSDVGAIAVLSFNDGPFLTMLALGILGTAFPPAVFLAVLTPIVLGMVLGNLDPEIRAFLAPGETLVIPFFAFALGTGMNLAVFLDPKVLLAGLALAAMTIVLTVPACVLTLRLVGLGLGFRNTISAFASGTVAGNAALVPAVVASAALGAAAAGYITPEQSAAFSAIAKIAPAQITVAILVTALVVPLLCYVWDRIQRAQGIDATTE